MQKLTAQLGFEDAERRSFLQCICAALGAVVFYLVLTRKGPVNDWLGLEAAYRPFIVFVFTVMFLGVTLFLALKKRWAWPTFIFAVGLVAVALYMRMAVMDVRSGDYGTFLEGWVAIFRAEGFSAITQDIGDYNLPYLYVLAAIARAPFFDMYLIKLVSILFDFLLALLMMQLVSRFLTERYALLTLSILLLIPTLWFNGSYWAQCDAIYVFFTMACLYAMLADRPILSVAMLTIAFAFKLQTIFFFPLVLYGLYFKKYKLRHALVFPVVYLLLILPAFFMGRPLVSCLDIYLRQSAQYNHRLTYNAANIYQLFPEVEVGYQPEWNILKSIPGVNQFGFDWAYTVEMMRRISQALIPFAGILVLAVVYYLYINRKYVTPESIWLLSLLFTLLMPMVLPKMHERYFLLAEMFAILYGLRYRKRFFVPILVVASSFFSYYPFLFRHKQIDMRLVALLMIAALCVVLADLIRGIRRARREDPKIPRDQVEPTYTL